MAVRPIAFLSRARRYRLLNAEPAIGARTTFFSAAATVCEALAFVPTTSFLATLSGELETFNLDRAKRIRAGALYAGTPVNRNTIEFVAAEQAFVESRLCALCTEDPRLFDSEVRAANRSLDLVSRGYLFCASPALAALARAALRVRGVLRRSPRFEQQSDRELVGRCLALGSLRQGTVSRDRGARLLLYRFQ